MKTRPEWMCIRLNSASCRWAWICNISGRDMRVASTVLCSCVGSSLATSSTSASWTNLETGAGTLGSKFASTMRRHFWMMTHASASAMCLLVAPALSVRVGEVDARTFPHADLLLLRSRDIKALEVVSCSEHSWLGLEAAAGRSARVTKDLDEGKSTELRLKSSSAHPDWGLTLIASVSGVWLSGSLSADPPVSEQTASVARVAPCQTPHLRGTCSSTSDESR